MTDILEMSKQLPGLLGFDSEDEFVIGYQPTEGGRQALSEEALQELREWSWIRTKAFQDLDQPRRVDGDELRGPLTELLERLSEFVAKRQRISDNAKWARRDKHPE